MPFKTIIDILQALGMLNIAAVILLLNLPAILFNIYMHVKLRMYGKDNYVSKTEITLLREDLNVFRTSVDKLSKAIEEDRLEIVRHQERFKLINELK